VLSVLLMEHAAGEAGK